MSLAILKSVIFFRFTALTFFLDRLDAVESVGILPTQTAQLPAELVPAG